MKDHFDVLIVGAGSAGATLAARLSEDPQRRVCLLEAGPDHRSADAPVEMRSPNPGAIVDPRRFPELQYPKLRARRSAVQRPRLYWRGRGVGGSSAINGQIAIRALPGDLDGWSRAGCTGWSWDEVLPFFCKLEDEELYRGEAHHGTGGPIPIHRAPLDAWGPVDGALRASALALGYPWCDDTEAPGATGVSTYAINSRGGARVTVNDAYLEPARDRPNLAIVGDALVDRVVFDGQRARAVRARFANAWSELSADLVIVSAGAVHSPAILMRSGVGPRPVLEEIGVKVVRELPVGENLQDHPIASIWLELTADSRAKAPDERHTNCCVRYHSGLSGAGANDMMIVALNDTVGFTEREQDLRLGSIGVWVNQCFSRGRLWVEGADPELDPTIELNMLDDERDRLRMRDGVRRLLEIVRRPEVAQIASGLRSGPAGGAIDALDSDAAIDAWASSHCNDTQHTTATCKMGPRDDPSSVVDPDCRVHGTEGLRVIDASVMPSVPRANTHLTTVMIAERMADRLRGRV